MEDVLDSEVRDAEIETVEEQWHARFAGAEHNDMSTTPAYIVIDADHSQATNVSIVKSQTDLEQVKKDGESFKRLYFQDAQRIFSRV